MKVIIFGASGMVGSAVLREALNASDIDKVLSIGRSELSLKHSKLESIASDDLFDLSDLSHKLVEYDACLFLLGTSIGNSTEEEYARLNNTLPIEVAKTMVAANPNMSFVYVSGKGTDSSEKGNVAWARIKGNTENSLLKTGFKAVYLLRPALIVPLNGEVSKTTIYRLLYRYTGWAMKAVQRFFPSMITDTEKVGTATLNLLRKRFSSAVIENDEINLIARE
jgi:uncharacterized protein YbjT (DUF2867 family)